MIEYFRLFISLGLSFYMEEVLLANCKITTLKNSDILDGHEDDESVAVLGNTENVVALENIDILVAKLEHIVTAAKWVAETVIKIALETVA